MKQNERASGKKLQSIRTNESFPAGAEEALVVLKIKSFQAMKRFRPRLCTLSAASLVVLSAFSSLSISFISIHSFSPKGSTFPLNLKYMRLGHAAARNIQKNCLAQAVMEIIVIIFLILIMPILYIKPKNYLSLDIPSILLP